MKKSEASLLCQQCTSFDKCLAETDGKPFAQELMRRRTYCTKFDNVDKSPRVIPFLQPYEVETYNATIEELRPCAR